MAGRTPVPKQMLTCNDIRDLGPDYPDGELRPGTRLGILLHLLLCGPCRIYIRQIRDLRRLLAGLPALTPPGPARSQAHRLFRNPLS